jgi:hypothetical protein
MGVVLLGPGTLKINKLVIAYKISQHVSDIKLILILRFDFRFFDPLAIKHVVMSAGSSCA